jgi:outer membrane protein
MTMRLLALTVLLAFTSLFGSVSAEAAPPTIALVDVQRILNESKASQSLQKQIQAKRESFQKELADKEKKLKDTEKSLISDKEKLSAEEFAKKRKAYEESIAEARKLFQQRRNSLEQGVGKGMEELKRNIAEAAAKVADEKKYDIVLTRDSVLLAEKSLDITADVLKNLDAKLPDLKLEVK